MRTTALFLAAILTALPAIPVRPETPDSAVQSAVPKAQADPTRPVFHFRAPAQWINDPNGPIQYKGVYHVFYQHNPYGDAWGNMHWGHARSKDLLHWEHLPIAIAPSKDKGEDHVFSGCCTLDGDGKPMIFYTSIGKREPEQWAARALDEDLITWKKLDQPALTQAIHANGKIREWRDPCIFRDGGKTFLVTGGMLDEKVGCVQLYEAENAELTQWKHRGTMHQEPGDIECPLFFKLKDKWVLILSIHGHAAYHTGTFDPAAGTFKSEASGLIDQSDQFYAPNTFQDDKGRRILIGWIRGFKNGLGWNGCFSLPRELTLLPDGHLSQYPIEETKQLLGDETSEEGFDLPAGARKLPNAKGDTACLFLKYDPKAGGSEAAGLNLRVSEDGKRKTTISYGKGQLDVAGQRHQLTLGAGEEAVTLVVFLDKSVVEVFAQNGRFCITRVIDADPADLNAEVFSRAGNLHVEKLKTWPVNSTWGKP
jgi:beta-fructofuranosidase